MEVGVTGSLVQSGRPSRADAAESTSFCRVGLGWKQGLVHSLPLATRLRCGRSGVRVWEDTLITVSVLRLQILWDKPSVS